MNWYYAVGDEQKGPVGDAEFQRLVQHGAITAQTLVWREGMANWQSYADAAPAPPIASPAPLMLVTCAGCGRYFEQTEVIPLADRVYCAACKPVAIQRLQEGVVSSTDAEATRKQYLTHEASVKSVGFLYYLGSVALFLIGVGALAARGAIEGFGAGFVFLVLGLGQFWVGTGLRRLKSWARIPTGILSGIGLLGFPIGTLINGYILYLVLCQKGKMVFSEEYREVIEQTPHIKYRTSIVVWILLGVLFLLFALAGIGLILGRRH